ncbi:hypothetical protein QZH44_29895 (plasmid) [Pseudomonas corrugata]|uniref:hypothetical protein n=1 Tax=Pseudomonas corrugata TaxID=47879 RepID=UPI003D81A103
MIDIEAHLVPLNLPSHVHAQAAQLLRAIAGAHNLYDTLQAATRAEGFGLDLETLKTQSPACQEWLFMAFDAAVQARQTELRT